MKVLEKAGTIFDKLNEIFVGVASVILAIGWLSVCIEVFMRYFLNRPTKWSMEVTENMIVFVTFLSTAWLLKHEGHAKIDILEVRLKQKTHFIFTTLTSILCAIACLLLFWYGGKLVWSQYVRGLRFATILEPKMWPLYVVIPMAFFMLFIQFLRRTHNAIKGWKSTEETPLDPKANT